MRRSLGAALLLLVGLLTGSAARETSPVADVYAVQSQHLEWQDTARQRTVPVKLYLPRQGVGPWPLIVFSHGLGGSRDGYAYLGAYWASAGYVVVHVQHPGSDAALWRGREAPRQALRQAVADPSNLRERPRDISFAIDQMTTLHKASGPLAGRLQLDRIGVAGHSFGAYTTLAVAGQVFHLPGGKTITFTDPRVRAAMPMSAPVPRQHAQLAAAFGAVRIPCLHMTGTLDDSPLGETSAAARRIPFDLMHAADQYLLTLQGGDHMVFAGLPRPRDASAHQLIRRSSLAFWEAYLRDSAEAKTWLAQGGFTRALGKEGTFEVKLHTP